MKSALINAAEAKKNQYISMANEIFDHPELGNQEFFAFDSITRQLESLGFTLERGIASLETAFRAIYRQGQGGPNIGLLCEYDALEGLGHACSHHLQAPAILLAAETLKDTLTTQNYTLTIYGTPAEETTHGKLRMIEQDYFKELDVALMMHGSPVTTCDIKSLALSNLEVIFHGKSAHAALKPEEGRSALDALLVSFQGIEYLREHVREDVRMHYTILETPGPANIVPERARGKFSLRSYSREYLNTVEKRVNDIVKGAALIAGVEYEIHYGDKLNNKIPVLKLNELLMEAARAVNAPGLAPPREKTGSSDFSNVMYEVPGSCIRIAFVPEGTSSHSQTFLEYGKRPEAHAALVYAAQILAIAATRLIEDPATLAAIKQEFEENKLKLK